MIALGLFVSVSVVSCGLSPEDVQRDDPRLEPLWAAIARVDREALGFTAIDPNAKIRLEGKQLTGDAYDAMLHFYGEATRSIAFRKDGSGYKWIGESEGYAGPTTYQTPDGTMRESISISYHLERMYGGPLNQLVVHYSGEDPRLPRWYESLTLADVKPILEEWKQKGSIPAAR